MQLRSFLRQLFFSLLFGWAVHSAQLGVLACFDTFVDTSIVYGMKTAAAIIFQSILNKGPGTQFSEAAGCLIFVCGRMF